MRARIPRWSCPDWSTALPVASGMSASTIRQKGRAVRLVYLCSTYLTYHGPENPTHCKSHQIRQDLLLELIQEWMQETGQTLSQLDSERNLLVALYGERATASEGLREARQALEAWMAEALEMVCEGEPTPDGRTRYCLGDWDFCLPDGEFTPVWECYQWLVSVMGKQDRDQVAALEAQHDRLCHALMLAPTELTRDKIAREVTRVEAELSSLRAEPGGLVGRIRGLLRELHEMAVRLGKAQRGQASSDLRRRTKAYQDLIEKIVVVHEPVRVRAGKPISTLTEVRIYPRAVSSECAVRGPASYG